MSWICDQGSCFGIANPMWLATCDSHLSQCPCVSLAEEREALVTCLWWEADSVLKLNPCLPPGTECGSHGWRSMVCIGLNQISKQDWRTGGHGGGLPTDSWIFSIVSKKFLQDLKLVILLEKKKKEIVFFFFICSKTPETPPCQMRRYCSYK